MEIAKIELTNTLSQCNLHGLSLSCIASDSSSFSGLHLLRKKVINRLTKNWNKVINRFLRLPQRFGKTFKIFPS